MKKTQWAIVLAATLAAFGAMAEPSLNASGYIDGEGIRFDPKTGNYIVTYYGDTPQGDRLVTLVYDPPNKVEPGVHVRLRASGGRDIAYGYEFSNGRGAKQNIFAFSFTARSPWWEEQDLITHSAAESQAAAASMPGVAQAIEERIGTTEKVEASRIRQSERWLPEISFSKDNRSFRIRWQAHPNNPPLDDIKPGYKRGGFGLTLPYLPGLVKFVFSGDSKPFGFPGAAGGESRIWKDLDKLMFGSAAPARSVESLGPKILVPEPFDARALAGAVAGDLSDWVKAGQLSEDLAMQLRGSLIAIGHAAEMNNPKGVSENAERVFRMLFSRHRGMRYADAQDGDDEARRGNDQPDLSYLAARAIAFNTFELTRRSASALARIKH